MPAGLSVIVVSWNAASVIEGCLASLLDNAPDRPFEILVLDNASRDRTTSLVRPYTPEVNLVELDTNLGFAGACNEGYRLSRHDYLLFLNCDVRVYPSALESLSGFMDSHPEAGAAGGHLLDAHGHPQRGFNVRAFPTLLSAAIEILLLDKVFPRNPVTRAQRMLDFSFSETSEVDQPAGACLLVRRSVFESVGRFDEKFYPAWFEDVDLCLRLKESGHRVFFVPEARFLHYGGASLESLDYREFLSIWYGNLLRYFGKHHGKSSTALLKGLILIGMLLRLSVTLLMKAKPGLSQREARSAYWQVIKETL
ncbi:MAG: glycosyltransferase family 2 protein [Vicinamibacteria bacterium]